MSVTREIVRHLADINSEEGLELNLVSWNGRMPKLDLRKWGKAEDGSPKPMKGLTLSRPEAEALSAALAGYLKEASDGV